jgi:hypothetical protein
MIFIVDIDQTICYTPLIDGVHHYDQSVPMKHRIDHINKLYDQGATIIYWTARGSGSGIDWTELTHKQLNDWGCKFHEIRLGKPSYDVWVDDKAFNDREFFFHADRDFELTGYNDE